MMPETKRLETKRLATSLPPLSESEKIGSHSGSAPGNGSEETSSEKSPSGGELEPTGEALENPARLRELQKSLGRLEDFASKAQHERDVVALEFEEVGEVRLTVKDGSDDKPVQIPVGELLNCFLLCAELALRAAHIRQKSLVAGDLLDTR